MHTGLSGLPPGPPYRCRNGRKKNGDRVRTGDIDKANGLTTKSLVRGRVTVKGKRNRVSTCKTKNKKHIELFF